MTLKAGSSSPDYARRRAIPDDAVIRLETLRDGGKMRVLSLQGRPPSGRGSILFLSGRADFFEKYLESLIHWRERGFDVTAMDWRGQGGSGRMAVDPLMGHAASFDPWVDDVDEMVAKWRSVSAPPHYLVAHSMGGHLALRLLAERGPALDGMVLTAPLLGLKVDPLPEWLARPIIRRKIKQGLSETYAWGQARRPKYAEKRRQRVLTRDPSRYEDEDWWKARQPELALGGVSWGWLDAAYRSIDRLKAAGALEKVALPVLFILPENDEIVSTPAALAMARRIPGAEVALFDGAHELLRETDPVREAVWARIDAFLDRRRAG